MHSLVDYYSHECLSTLQRAISKSCKNDGRSSQNAVFKFCQASLELHQASCAALIWDQNQTFCSCCIQRSLDLRCKHAGESLKLWCFVAGGSGAFVRKDGIIYWNFSPNPGCYCQEVYTWPKNTSQTYFHCETAMVKQIQNHQSNAFAMIMSVKKY